MALERISELPALRKRRPESHKGDYGSILVVAGGRGMAGAAALVGASALRSGAGLVRVACPAEVQPTVASFEPSYMTYPLLCGSDGLVRDSENQEDLAGLLAAADVLAVGPGLGRGTQVAGLVAWLLQTATMPVVLDADGLNAWSEVGGLDLARQRSHPLVITPHPGEFSRLTGLTVADVLADREAAAVALAGQAEGLVVVLKGAGTIVTDGQRVYTNRSGNPGMATGGAGDVLTGVIAALLGQGLSPFDAAALGTYVHGLAGDIARDQNGEVGMIAGDIVDSLPDAFYHLGTQDPEG